MSLIIKKSSFAEMEAAPNVKQLLDEYAQESAINGLPHPAAKVDMYKHMESVGAIHVIAAFQDELLIGFVTVLSPVLPHYGIKIAVAESFFVFKAHRKSGAGLKLLHAAEAHSKEVEAYGLLVSAPTGGNLAEVLPHVGYEETNRVFFRNFNNE